MTGRKRPTPRLHRKGRRFCAWCAAALMGAAVICMAVLPSTGSVQPEATQPRPVTFTPTPSPSPPPPPQPEPVDPPEVEALTETPAECLARMLYGEARGCTTTEQAAAVWCALNRVDSDDPYFPDDVVGVVTQSGAFYGYDPDHPILPELLAVAEDVLARWSVEDDCVGSVGRVLPAEYLYFSGDGQHNYFRSDYIGGETWDWSLASPYAK